MQEFTQEQNIKEKNQIYYSSQSEHSLIIHQIPTNSAQQQQKLQKCLDHVRQLTRSRKWKHKEGRGTSHSYWSRTMVQGELLTVHTGGFHGYGWSPGGGSSSRQGAAAASPGSPDLETAAAVQRRDREKEIRPRGFRHGG